MTPGATLSILKQFYRILKHGGQFLAIEHPFLEEVKPANKAQELELEFRKILCQIRHQEFGKGTYRPEQLSEKLKKIGFDRIYWRTVSEGQSATREEVTSMIEGVRNLANEVKDRKNKEEILEKIKDLAHKAEKSGFCEPPYYAPYARKP